MKKVLWSLALAVALLAAGSSAKAVTSIVDPLLPANADILFEVTFDGFELSAAASATLPAMPSVAIGWVGPGLPITGTGLAPGDFLMFVPDSDADGLPEVVAISRGGHPLLPDFTAPGVLGPVTAWGVGTISSMYDVTGGVPVQLADFRDRPGDLIFSVNAQMTFTVADFPVVSIIPGGLAGTLITTFGTGGTMWMLEDQSADFDALDVAMFPGGELLTAYQSGNLYHNGALVTNSSSASTVGLGIDGTELLFLSLTNSPLPGDTLQATDIFDPTGTVRFVELPDGSLQAIYVDGSSDFGTSANRTIIPTGGVAYPLFVGARFYPAADLAFGIGRTGVFEEDPLTYTFQSPPETGVDFIGGPTVPEPATATLALIGLAGMAVAGWRRRRHA